VLSQYLAQIRALLLAFRYDNARHQPPMLSSSHKHLPEQVVASTIPALEDVLAEITVVMGWV